MLRYKGILFFTVLFFSALLFAQENQEKKPLVEIITNLQEVYDYHFTFADEVVSDVFVHPPKQGLTFKEIINYLQRETGLAFQFLKNNFIAIKPNDSLLFVCGYIIDYETGSPLEAVTIVGKNSYAISDAFGYFKIKVTSKKESISIRYLGFQPQNLLAGSFLENDCTNIFLIPQIESLSEVVLRNFIIKGIDKVADGSVNINFPNFGILPGLIETDVLQTVQVLPGIQSINETVSNINIRGGTNDQNLLLWDGIKMYQTGHFFGLISMFNPLITTNVSVIKNGTSVEYTNGVSGTIAMKTDTNISNTFTASIGSNFINSTVFADIPISKKSSIQISGRKAISDLLEDLTYAQYFHRILQNNPEIDTDGDADIKFDFYDTSVRWLYNITDKDQLRLNFLAVNNELTFNNDVLADIVTAQSKESSLKQATIAEGLFYKRNWSDRFVTTLQVYETDYTLESNNADFITQQSIQQENKVSETSIKLNTWFKYNNQLSFLNGYQFIETGITNISNLSNQDIIITDEKLKVIRENAIFSQVQFTSNSKKTNIKAGARYTYFEKFNKHIVEHLIEPRLSLHHKITHQLAVEVLGEFKHQNTFQIINVQNDFLGIEKRRWFLSDSEEIPLTKSKQVSLGFTYNNKGWLLSTEGYFKKVDGITSQSQAFLNQYANRKEIGSYQVKGIEFLVNKRFRKFSTWLSYTYADNIYTFRDFEEINFPNNIDITHTLVVGSSYSLGNFKISGGFNWHTGKPTTKPIDGNEIAADGNTINYTTANSSNLEEYIRTDASATYTFKLADNVKIHTGVSILNILNHNNIINNRFVIANNTTKEISNEALGFTYNFNFRVEFK